MNDSLAAWVRPFAACCVLLMTACTLVPTGGDVQTPPKVEPVQQPVVDKAAERERQKRERRQETIEALLRQADAAVADNRLTLPLYDNAYDRYAAVRLLDPDNPRAKAGLESILLRYSQLVRSALRQGRLDEAQQLFERAQEYYRGNPLLADLQSDIQQAGERARQQLQRLNEQALEENKFELPALELSRKSPAVIELLTRVAKRLRETHESVLILARTDAEGRWIYKQMNDAVPDYRIRGNIHLSSSPGLRILPPL